MNHEDSLKEPVSCSLRNWAFVATIENMNLTHAITLLGLVSQPAFFIWLCGVGSPVQCRKKFITSDSSAVALGCICIHQSWLPWWLPPALDF